MANAWLRVSASLTVFLSTGAVSASAQTNERTFEQLDFRFVTPGARAVGLGGTFVGLADDATAASSNPAGLSNLLEPEVSIEFNGTQILHQRFAPGAPGETRTFGDRVLVPSFFSYAIPARRATFLLFRQTLQKYRETFVIDPRFIPSIGATEPGGFGSIASTVETYGVGGSFVVSPQWSIGATVVLSNLDLAVQGRSGAVNNPRNGTTTINSGYAWTGTLGVLFKFKRSLSVGAAYFGGATFDAVTTLYGSFLYHGNDLVFTGDQRPVQYVVPDRFAAGASWRSRNNLTLLVDVSRVRYSRLITDKFLVVDFMDPDAGLSRNNFFINDVTELHAGAEYRFYRSGRTYALRGGLFTDPDHAMHYRSSQTPQNDIAQLADRYLDFRFNSLKPGTAVGLSGGGGFAFGNTVQVDLAGSFSRDSRQVVVSTVIRLNRHAS